jgi:hypothetical protein
LERKRDRKKTNWGGKNYLVSRGIVFGRGERMKKKPEKQVTTHELTRERKGKEKRSKIKGWKLCSKKESKSNIFDGNEIEKKSRPRGVKKTE